MALLKGGQFTRGLKQHYLVHDNESSLHTRDKRGKFKGGGQANLDPATAKPSCLLSDCYTAGYYAFTKEANIFFFILGKKYFP